MFFYPDIDAYALLFLLYVFGKHDVTFVFTILLFAGFVTCQSRICDLSRCCSYQLPVMFPEILSSKLLLTC
jgi:hypothetical protein